MSNISLTVDSDDKESLISAAIMLLIRAGKMPAPAVPDMLGAPIENIDDSNSLTAPEYTPPADSIVNITKEALADGWPSGANPIETDENGLPWDARIHASTKTKTAKGVWKRRKGVDDSVVEQVEAELRQVMAIPSAGQESPATSEGQQPSVVIPPPEGQQPSVVIPPPEGQQPSVVIPPPDQQQQNVEGPKTFAEFVKGCGAKISGGTITMARILEIINGKGIPSLQAVNNQPHLIPELWSDIDAL